MRSHLLKKLVELHHRRNPMEVRIEGIGVPGRTVTMYEGETVNLSRDTRFFMRPGTPHPLQTLQDFIEVTSSRRPYDHARTGRTSTAHPNPVAGPR